MQLREQNGDFGGRIRCPLSVVAELAVLWAAAVLRRTSTLFAEFLPVTGELPHDAPGEPRHDRWVRVGEDPPGHDLHGGRPRFPMPLLVTFRVGEPGACAGGEQPVGNGSKSV